MTFARQVLEGVRDIIVNEVHDEQHAFAQQISGHELTMTQVNLYVDEMVTVQLKSSAQKTKNHFKEQAKIDSKTEVPDIILHDCLLIVESEIRHGFDNIKFDLLLKASLRDKSLTSSEIVSIEAQIKRAYDFFLRNPDGVFVKVKDTCKALMSLFVLTNMPCSKRHYDEL